MTARRTHRTITTTALLTALAATPTLAWQIEPVDLGGNSGGPIDLAVGTDGSRHATYFTSGGADSYRFNYGNGWISGLSFGNHEDLAIDSNNFPHLLELDNGTPDRLFVQRPSAVPPDFVIWIGEQATSGTIADHAQILFGPNDQPHIAYIDTLTEQLRHTTTLPNGAWSTSIVATEDNFSSASPGFEFDLDPNGQPHFVYRRDSSQLIHARPFGGSWQLDSVTSLGNVRPYDIKIDSGGDIHLAYNLITGSRFSGGLHYAKYEGSGWSGQRVNGLDGFGDGDSEIALGPNNEVNIFTLDGEFFGPDLLKRATQTPTGWDFDTIDSWVNNGFGSEALSPVIDHNGDVHVLYADDSQNIFYAFLDEGPDTPAPVTVALAPVADGETDFDNFTLIVGSSGDSLVAQEIDFLNRDRRIILEFDLASLPSDAVITGASLDARAWLKTTPPDPILQLRGYVADGSITGADFSAGGPVIGTSQPLDDLGPVSIPLDIAYLQQRLTADELLGMVGNSLNGSQFGIYSSEWFRAEDRPFLNLEYQLLADIQPGDINLDGSVGTPDLAILAGFFLDSGVGYHEGDLNLDGTVNTSDLAILAGFFGEGTGAGIAPGSATVPEPATLAWLAIAGLAAITRRSTSHHA